MIAIAVVVVVGALALAAKLDALAVERVLTLLLGYVFGRGPMAKKEDLPTPPQKV